MRYATWSGGEQVDVPNVLLTRFSDTGIISSCKGRIKWAYSVGLINGRTDTTLAPKGTATRAEVATIIQRFDEKPQWQSAYYYHKQCRGMAVFRGFGAYGQRG